MLFNGTNAAVLKYCAIMSSVPEKSRRKSSAVAPDTSAGYWPPEFSEPFCPTSTPVVNTSGVPDWRRWNPVIVHPFSNALEMAFE